MQNKSISVELIGNNNSGKINSIFTGDMSNQSSFEMAKIPSDSMFSKGINNINITKGFSNALNSDILVMPIQENIPSGDSSYTTKINAYIYSNNNGESWNLLKFYNNEGKNFIAPTEFDVIAYANGKFYACPSTSNFTTKYLESDDCSTWVEKNFKSYLRLRWVDKLNDSTILMLVYDYDNTILYSSNDNGNTLTQEAVINGIDLDRILITDSYIYLYSQYAKDVYISQNNGIGKLSFSIVNDLNGTCNMSYGEISYQKSGTIFTENRIVATMINSNNKIALSVIGDNGNLIGSTITRLLDRQGSTVPPNSLIIYDNKVFFGFKWQLTNLWSIDGCFIFDMLNLDGSSKTIDYNYGGSICILDNMIISIRDSVLKNYGSGIVVQSPIMAYKSMYIDDYNNIEFIEKPICLFETSELNENAFSSSNISKNDYSKIVNNKYSGMLFNCFSNTNKNNNSNYDYNSTLFIFGKNIRRLIMFFDNANNIFPTKMLINGTEYNNNDSYFSVDFGYGKYDAVIIKFIELNKPDSQLSIGGINTDVNCIFNRINGLNYVNISSTDEQSPHYGIISYSGEVEVNDRYGILKILSDLELLPNIVINIYIQNNKKYTFVSNNEVTYSDKDAIVYIELLDEIQFLQSLKNNKLYFSNMNAFQLFNNLASLFPYQVSISDEVSKRISNINILKIVFDSDNWWNVWNSFCIGTKTFFYKDANNIYRIGE